MTAPKASQKKCCAIEPTKSKTQHQITYIPVSFLGKKKKEKEKNDFTIIFFRRPALQHC